MNLELKGLRQEDCCKLKGSLYYSCSDNSSPRLGSYWNFLFPINIFTAIPVGKLRLTAVKPAPEHTHTLRSQSRESRESYPSGDTDYHPSLRVPFLHAEGIQLCTGPGPQRYRPSCLAPVSMPEEREPDRQLPGKKKATTFPNVCPCFRTPVGFGLQPERVI